MKRLAFLAVVAFAMTGCMGAYTDIRKVDDNTYIVTKTQQGFMRTVGTVLQCSPVGPSGDLKCTVVDAP